MAEDPQSSRGPQGGARKRNGSQSRRSPSLDAIGSYWESNPLRALIGPASRWFYPCLAGWYVLGFLVSAAEHTIVLPKAQVGCAEDIPFFAYLVFLPALRVLTFRLLSSLERLLRQLPDLAPDGSGADRDSCSVPDLKEDIRRIRDCVGLRTRTSRNLYWGLIFLLLASVYVFQLHIPILRRQPVTAWTTSPHEFPLGFCFNVAWALFVYPGVVGNCLWYAAAVTLAVFPMVSRYAATRRIMILPISHDKRGGISALGDLALGVTLMGGTGLIFVTSWIIVYGLDLPGLLGLLIYLGLLTTVFVAPVWSVHRTMKRARSGELDRIARLFRQMFLTLPSADAVRVESGELLSAEMRRNIDTLAKIDSLYRRVEAMPAWPFNSGAIREFLTIIIIPLLLAIVQGVSGNSLLEWFRRLLP